MIGKFEYVILSFRNCETNELKEFKPTTPEEMNKIDDQFESLEWKRHKRGYIKCSCGKMVACNAFTNTCECGVDYNFAGERLAPRSQWGEETGENWTDCY